jgi:hypothetical protein
MRADVVVQIEELDQPGCESRRDRGMRLSLLRHDDDLPAQELDILVVEVAAACELLEGETGQSADLRAFESSSVEHVIQHSVGRRTASRVPFVRPRRPI